MVVLPEFGLPTIAMHGTADALAGDTDGEGGWLRFDRIKSFSLAEAGANATSACKQSAGWAGILCGREDRVLIVLQLSLGGINPQ
jgi:hypothetical protein